MKPDPRHAEPPAVETAGWSPVEGVLVPGHGVASGTGADRRYPAGTLEMQRPFFARLGLDLGTFHGGTLNVDIAPRGFALARPAHTFRRVAWTDLHPPEDFSFSRCRILHDGRCLDAWIYTPHPETKAAHFQPPTMMEVIAPFLTGIRHGDRLRLLVASDEIALSPPVFQ